MSQGSGKPARIRVDTTSTRTFEFPLPGGGDYLCTCDVICVYNQYWDAARGFYEGDGVPAERRSAFGEAQVRFVHDLLGSEKTREENPGAAPPRVDGGVANRFVKMFCDVVAELQDFFAPATPARPPSPGGVALTLSASDDGFGDDSAGSLPRNFSSAS